MAEAQSSIRVELDAIISDRCVQYGRSKETQTRPYFRAGQPAVEIPGVHSDALVSPHPALHSVHCSVAIRVALFPNPIEEKCVSSVAPIRAHAWRMLGQYLLKGRQIFALGAYPGRLGHAHDDQAKGRWYQAPIAVIVAAGFPSAVLHIASAPSESLMSREEPAGFDLCRDDLGEKNRVRRVALDQACAVEVVAPLKSCRRLGIVSRVHVDPTAHTIGAVIPVGLEFVIRPPLEAGPCPGSGRSNAHG